MENMLTKPAKKPVVKKAVTKKKKVIKKPAMPKGY
jgi:hypothetical protein